MNVVIVGLYFGVLAILCAYGVHRSYLVWLLNRHARPAVRPPLSRDELPSVVVQLPVFNEANVIDRLISAACALDYPSHLLKIQVLDDSTDETTDIARRLILEHREHGVAIELIHREDRVGFKAGALAAGLARTDAELVAIFDADFVPPRDFLTRTASYFTDPGLGMVQGRWVHLNRDRSLLTRLQAHLLDAHFLIEHNARSSARRFFNFNGTAGVWRRRCILEAGGWLGDTLTEDLDLSYRAQLAGWHFLFLADVHVPAELPEDLNAFKSQQRRWAKGSMQTARKLLGKILRSDVPIQVKIEAVFHLTANIAHPLMVALALLLLPTLTARWELGWELQWIVAIDAAAIAAATGSLALFYMEAGRLAVGRRRDALFHLPALMALGIGISASNAVAVIEGLLGPVGSFVRTPKSGSVPGTPYRPLRAYRGRSDWIVWLELVIAMYTAMAVAGALALGTWGSLPFLLLFPSGYLAVSALSMAAARRP